jgi:hypothetical protein
VVSIGGLRRERESKSAKKINFAHARKKFCSIHFGKRTKTVGFDVFISHALELIFKRLLCFYQAAGMKDDWGWFVGDVTLSAIEA